MIQFSNKMATINKEQRETQKEMCGGRGVPWTWLNQNHKKRFNFRLLDSLNSETFSMTLMLATVAGTITLQSLS